jgi:hypothetical protein
MNPLVLLGTVVVVSLLLARRQNSRLPKLVGKPGRHYFPKAISVLILTAQVSELVKVVEHISIVNIFASLMLFVILVATKTGTEGELH